MHEKFTRSQIGDYLSSRAAGIVMCLVGGVGLGGLWIRFLPRNTPSALWRRFAEFLPDLIVTSVLVAVVVYVLRTLLTRQKRPTQVIKGAAVVGPIFFTDEPEGGTTDTFALDKISELLARDILLPSSSPSLVVSLEGPWGSGKTSLLNAVAERLGAAPSCPIVIPFDTWELPTGEVLAQSLLQAMREGIKNRGGTTKLDDALQGLGEGIDHLIAKKDDSILGTLLHSAIKLLGFSDFGDVRRYKSQINARLEDLGVPIVVLLDDVDRLMPPEIRSVFQLVHGAIDFTRVCYVLAYDPMPVHHALATVPGDVESGRKFKDKIVQVAIAFPRISPLRRHHFATSLLQKALMRRSIAPDENDTARRADAVSILLQLLRTPRAIKQALNKIGFSAELLSGEVCVSDIMVFEALQLHCPALTQQLRDRPELILQLHQRDEIYSVVTMQIVHELHEKVAQQKAVEEIVQSGAPNDPSGQARINGALKFVFPSLFSKSSNHLEDPGPLGRIDDPSNLKKLLYLTVQPDSESTRDVREFLDRPQSRSSILADRSTPTATAAFFNQVGRHLANGGDVNDPRDLIDRVLECADVWLSSEGEDLTRDAASLFEHLLNDTTMAPADRLKLLRYLAIEAHRVSIGTNVLTSAFKQLGLWLDGEWHPDGHYQGSDKAGWCWLTRADAERLRTDWIARFDSLDWEQLAIHEAQFSGLLYRRAQYDSNNYVQLHQRLRDLLMKSDDAARCFARPYGRSWSASGLEKLVPDMYWLYERLKSVRANQTAIENIRDQFEKLIAQGESLDPSVRPEP